MSYTIKGRNLRYKKGRRLMGCAITIDARTVSETISGALHAALYGLKKPIGFIAERISANDSTAKNIYYAKNAPSADNLIKLMREFDEVYEAVMVLSNRKSVGQFAPDQIQTINEALTILQRMGDANENDNHRRPQMGTAQLQTSR